MPIGIYVHASCNEYSKLRAVANHKEHTDDKTWAEQFRNRQTSVDLNKPKIVSFVC
jgi:hypothetical protein